MPRTSSRRKRPPLSPVTVRSYAGKVALALAASGAGSLREMAARPTASFARLRARYPKDSTLKQLLTAVLAAAAADTAVPAACLARWRALHAAVARGAAAARTGELTPEQAGRYVCWAAIERAARDAERAPGAHATLRASMATLLLSMVTRLYPKRADYGELAVVRPGAAAGGNRLLLPPRRGGATLVLTEFKTAAAHGEMTQPCGPAVTAQLRRSLARWPRRHAFVSAATGEPLSPGAYGRLVRDTLQAAVGEPVGVTMLRHIFISDVVVHKGARERAAVARLMMHSTREQAAYEVTRRGGRAACAGGLEAARPGLRRSL